MALDPARASLVTQEYRYTSSDNDPAIKAKFPAANDIIIDTNLDATGAMALSTALFNSSKSYARVFTVDVEGVLYLEDFTTGPNRYVVDFGKRHPAATSGPAFDFTGGSLPVGATLTRSAGMATYYNSSGVLSTAETNVARFDYNPLTLASRGLLIEPASSNLFTQSEDYSQSIWTTTAMAKAATGIRETAISGFFNIGQTISYSAQSYTISVIAKMASGSAFRYLGFGSPSGSGGAGFDVLNGVLGGVAGNMSAHKIEQVSATEFRVSAVVTPSASSAGSFQIGTSTNATPFSAHAGATANGFDIKGAQFEPGARLTSRIPTTSSSASRAADVLTLNWGAMGLADGTVTARYTFDDNSTQNVATSVSGGTSVVPTNLNRPWIKSIAVAPTYTLIAAKVDFLNNRTTLTVRG